MRSLLHSVLDVFFPPRCVGCETVLVTESVRMCCPRCDAAIRWINGPVGSPHIPLGLIDQLAACCALQGPMAQAIHRFKYGHRCDLARPLATLLHSVIAAQSADSVLVPVPLAQQRLRERGYNHTQLLARALNRRNRVPVVAHALARVRETPPQVGQERKERLTNVRGAFAVTAPAQLRGRDVVLVDDVMTTGATLSACARAVRKAGARTVSAIVIAVA